MFSALAVVGEQDIARLQAVGRGVGAGCDHVDQQAVIGQRLGVARRVGPLVDRVAQGQQAGMAVGPGLLPQVLEHGGRGGVAHRPGVVGGQQRLDRDARHGPRGQDDQPPGRRQAVGRGGQGPGQRLEALGA